MKLILGFRVCRIYAAAMRQNVTECYSEGGRVHRCTCRMRRVLASATTVRLKVFGGRLGALGVGMGALLEVARWRGRGLVRLKVVGTATACLRRSPGLWSVWRADWHFGPFGGDCASRRSGNAYLRGCKCGRCCCRLLLAGQRRSLENGCWAHNDVIADFPIVSTRSRNAKDK